MKNLKNFKQNKQGFTLIEIIVVLVIMGILLAIAVPSILGYVGKAQDAKYLAQARGGYLAAQTINAKYVATTKAETVATTPAAINFTTVNDELGLAGTEEGAVTAITCTFKDGNKNLDTCTISVTGATDKEVVFDGTEAKVNKKVNKK